MEKETGDWSKLDWLKSNGPAERSQTPLAPSPAASHDPSPEELRLTYRPKLIVMLACIACFGFGGLFFWDKAATNDRGLILEGAITLSSFGATIFYRVLSVTSFAFVALAMLFGVPRSLMKREVVLDATSISIPGHGWGRRQHRIDFSDITALRMTRVKRQRFLKILHTGGSRSLSLNMLNGDGDREQLLHWIAARSPHLWVKDQ